MQNYCMTVRPGLDRLAFLPWAWSCSVVFTAALLVLSLCPSIATAEPSAGRFAWTYGYDKQGRIAHITDPANQETTVQYSHDSGHNLVGMALKYPDGSTVRYRFDDRGRRIEMTDEAGVVTYAYDRFGRLTRVQRDGTPTLAYAYDTADRITAIRIGSDFQLNYTYDFCGRPKTIGTPIGDILYAYNSKTGSVSRRLPNGITTHWTRSPDDRLESITHTATDGKPLAQYDYAYRLDGLITTIKELTPNGTQTNRYKYDTAQRLVAATLGDRGSFEYDYDGLGNRTRYRQPGEDPISARYDWMNRLVEYDGNSGSYDAAGNLTARPGHATSYRFGPTGLLAAAQSAASEVRYTYDGDGSMIERLAGTSRMRFLPDPMSDMWRPLLATDHHSRATLYIWEGALPLMAIQGDTARIYLHDHLGSVRHVTDRQGRVMRRLDYAPFGDFSANTMSSEFEPRFAGLFHDPVASVYLTHARAYEPRLGRFLQRDPIMRTPLGEQEALSLYSYCANDPVNYVDDNGGARRPAANVAMDWGAIASDLQQRQQEMRSRQDRMMADLQQRQQEMRGRQDRMMAQQQQRQQEMRGRQDRMMAEQQRRQQEMRWRQSDRSAMFQQKYQTMLDRAREQTQNVGSNQLAGAVRFRNDTIAMLGDAYMTQVARLGRVASLGTGSLLLGGLSIVTEEVGLARMEARDPGHDYRGPTRALNMLGNVKDVAQLGLGIGRSVHLRQFIREGWIGPDKVLNRSGQMLQWDYWGRTTQWRIITDPSKVVDSFGKFGLGQVVELISKKSGAAIGQHVSRNIQPSILWDPSDSSVQMTSSRSSYTETVKHGVRSVHHHVSPLGPIGAQVGAGFGNAPVGGIRLAGAGEALSHLGQLEGVAIDPTNDRLVLIASGRRPIDLPPLRLDDVVTIFRSVYYHGEAPSVSIDPISDKESEKWMNVRHGSATANTYVGWVLYEADRVMKCYQLGKDNRTKKPWLSRVRAYRDFYENDFVFGKVWERFWIVPAALRRAQGDTSVLTVLDVPLKVATERMEWDGQRLVTAANPRPSETAKQFTDWFTRMYDGIADEVRIEPPKDSRITGKVAIFHELRRIALITAIAETLRDQNVPFPAWMHDYPVRTFEFDRQTPILRVEKRRVEITGGVQLAASDADTHLRTDDREVTRLAQTALKQLESRPLFASVSFEHEGKAYTAVPLPGADTRQNGANVMAHTDLMAPVLLETGIAPTRHANSFFDPTDIFGRGWTLDLPRLHTFKRPVSNDGRAVQYEFVYELSSPLNTWSERFAETKHVAEVGGELKVPARSKFMLGVRDAHVEAIGVPTKELLFSDGVRWHFDEAGHLMARIDAEHTVLYRRDESHRISSIKAHDRRNGGRQLAELRLTYDGAGKLVRLIEAHLPQSDAPAKAHYFYDQAGQLAMVVASDFRAKYTYNDGCVASVSINDEESVVYQYNGLGQIVREGQGDGIKVAYERNLTSYGSKVVAVNDDSRQPLESIEYDAALRPLRRTFEDGSSIAWDRGDDAFETTITTDGEFIKLVESSDGTTQRLTTSQGDMLTSVYDEKARVTRTQLEGGPTIEQHWHSDGRPGAVIGDHQGMVPSYDSKGGLRGLELAPADQVRQGNVTQYIRLEHNAEGRVSQVTDDQGGQLEIQYDSVGMPTLARSNRGSIAMERDNKGQLLGVKTSWDIQESYEYDSKGTLKLVAIESGASERATIELSAGRLTRIRQPDGGETKYDYYAEGLLQKITTPQAIELAYAYDRSSQMTQIDVGDGGTPAYRIQYQYDSHGRVTGISFTPPRR